MEIGNVICKLRTEAKLTQAQFAEIAGVSQQSIQKWESGVATPDLNKIVAISRYFDVSLDALILGNDNRVVEEMNRTSVIKPQYQNLHDWEFYSANIQVEYAQSTDEGLDVERYEDIFNAVARLPKGEIKKRFGDILFDVVLSAPKKEGYKYVEPSELDKIKELDLWKDKTFEEVGIEALKAKSEEKEKAGKVEQEKSTEYIRPSELVAAEVAAKALPVSMDGRGLESLTRMSDRETLSRAETYYGKDGKFSDLYHGKNVLKSEEESEYGLMVRLAMFCGGDQDRLLRVFRSSGQYREEKPNAYYEKMAENSLKFISDTKRSFAPMGEQSGFSKGKQGINSKR